MRRPIHRPSVAMIDDVFGRRSGYTVIPKWMLSTAGIVSWQAREIRELLPRYEHATRFDSSKFSGRFPEFEITDYRRGAELIRG